MSWNASCCCACSFSVSLSNQFSNCFRIGVDGIGSPFHLVKLLLFESLDELLPPILTLVTQELLFGSFRLVAMYSYETLWLDVHNPFRYFLLFHDRCEKGYQYHNGTSKALVLWTVPLRYHVLHKAYLSIVQCRKTQNTVKHARLRGWENHE
jgi:hypothetical protein